MESYTGKNKKKSRKNVLSNESGLAAVEFALIAPLFLLLLFAMTEFGLYMMQRQIADRTVDRVASAIQRNAGDHELIDNSTGDDVLLQSIAYDSGTRFINFAPTGDEGDDYVCAKSYPTYAEAKAGGCASGEFTTQPPAGVNGGYYVIIKAHVEKRLIMPFASYLPPVDTFAVVLTEPMMIPRGTILPFANSTCTTGMTVNSPGCACPPGWYHTTQPNYYNGNGRALIGLGFPSGIAGAVQRSMNERYGERAHSITIPQMARHKHNIAPNLYTTNEGNDMSPSGDVEWDGPGIYVKPTGGNVPMPVQDPFVGLQYCIKD